MPPLQSLLQSLLNLKIIRCCLRLAKLIQMVSHVACADLDSSPCGCTEAIISACREHMAGGGARVGGRDRQEAGRGAGRQLDTPQPRAVGVFGACPIKAAPKKSAVSQASQGEARRSEAVITGYLCIGNAPAALCSNCDDNKNKKKLSKCK